MLPNSARTSLNNFVLYHYYNVLLVLLLITTIIISYSGDFFFINALTEINEDCSAQPERIIEYKDRNLGNVSVLSDLTNCQLRITNVTVESITFEDNLGGASHSDSSARITLSGITCHSQTPNSFHHFCIAFKRSLDNIDSLTIDNVKREGHTRIENNHPEASSTEPTSVIHFLSSMRNIETISISNVIHDGEGALFRRSVQCRLSTIFFASTVSIQSITEITIQDITLVDFEITAADSVTEDTVVAVIDSEYLPVAGSFEHITFQNILLDTVSVTSRAESRDLNVSVMTMIGGGRRIYGSSNANSKLGSFILFRGITSENTRLEFSGQTDSSTAFMRLTAISFDGGANGFQNITFDDVTLYGDNWRPDGNANRRSEMIRKTATQGMSLRLINVEHKDGFIGKANLIEKEDGITAGNMIAADDSEQYSAISFTNLKIRSILYDSSSDNERSQIALLRIATLREYSIITLKEFLIENINLNRESGDFGDFINIQLYDIFGSATSNNKLQCIFDNPSFSPKASGPTKLLLQNLILDRSTIVAHENSRNTRVVLSGERYKTFIVPQCDYALRTIDNIKTWDKITFPKMIESGTVSLSNIECKNSGSQNSCIEFIDDILRVQNISIENVSWENSNYQLTRDINNTLVEDAESGEDEKVALVKFIPSRLGAIADHETKANQGFFFKNLLLADGRIEERSVAAGAVRKNQTTIYNVYFRHKIYRAATVVCENFVIKNWVIKSRLAPNSFVGATNFYVSSFVEEVSVIVMKDFEISNVELEDVENNNNNVISSQPSRIVNIELARHPWAFGGGGTDFASNVPGFPTHSMIDINNMKIFNCGAKLTNQEIIFENIRSGLSGEGQQMGHYKTIAFDDLSIENIAADTKNSSAVVACYNVALEGPILGDLANSNSAGNSIVSTFTIKNNNIQHLDFKTGASFVSVGSVTWFEGSYEARTTYSPTVQVLSNFDFISLSSINMNNITTFSYEHVALIQAVFFVSIRSSYEIEFNDITMTSITVDAGSRAVEAGPSGAKIETYIAAIANHDKGSYMFSEVDHVGIRNIHLGELKLRSQEGAEAQSIRALIATKRISANTPGNYHTIRSNYKIPSSVPASSLPRPPSTLVVDNVSLANTIHESVSENCKITINLVDITLNSGTSISGFQWTIFNRLTAEDIEIKPEKSSSVLIQLFHIPATILGPDVTSLTPAQITSLISQYPRQAFALVFSNFSISNVEVRSQAADVNIRLFHQSQNRQAFARFAKMLFDSFELRNVVLDTQSGVRAAEVYVIKFTTSFGISKGMASSITSTTIIDDIPSSEQLFESVASVHIVSNIDVTNISIASRPMLQLLAFPIKLESFNTALYENFNVVDINSAERYTSAHGGTGSSVDKMVQLPPAHDGIDFILRNVTAIPQAFRMQGQNGGSITVKDIHCTNSGSAKKCLFFEDTFENLKNFSIENVRWGSPSTDFRVIDTTPTGVEDNDICVIDFAGKVNDIVVRNNNNNNAGLFIKNITLADGSSGVSSSANDDQSFSLYTVVFSSNQAGNVVSNISVIHIQDLYISNWTSQEEDITNGNPSRSFGTVFNLRFANRFEHIRSFTMSNFVIENLHVPKIESSAKCTLFDVCGLTNLKMNFHPYASTSAPFNNNNNNEAEQRNVMKIENFVIKNNFFKLDDKGFRVRNFDSSRDDAAFKLDPNYNDIIFDNISIENTHVETYGSSQSATIDICNVLYTTNIKGTLDHDETNNKYSYFNVSRIAQRDNTFITESGAITISEFSQSEQLVATIPDINSIRNFSHVFFFDLKFVNNQVRNENQLEDFLMHLIFVANVESIASLFSVSNIVFLDVALKIGGSFNSFSLFRTAKSTPIMSDIVRFSCQDFVIRNYTLSSNRPANARGNTNQNVLRMIWVPRDITLRPEYYFLHRDNYYHHQDSSSSSLASIVIQNITVDQLKITAGDCQVFFNALSLFEHLSGYHFVKVDGFSFTNIDVAITTRDDDGSIDTSRDQSRMINFAFVSTLNNKIWSSFYQSLRSSSSSSFSSQSVQHLLELSSFNKNNNNINNNTNIPLSFIISNLTIENMKLRSPNIFGAITVQYLLLRAGIEGFAHFKIQNILTKNIELSTNSSQGSNGASSILMRAVSITGDFKGMMTDVLTGGYHNDHNNNNNISSLSSFIVQNVRFSGNVVLDAPGTSKLISFFPVVSFGTLSDSDTFHFRDFAVGDHDNDNTNINKLQITGDSTLSMALLKLDGTGNDLIQCFDESSPDILNAFGSTTTATPLTSDQLYYISHQTQFIVEGLHLGTFSSSPSSSSSSSTNKNLVLSATNGQATIRAVSLYTDIKGCNSVKFQNIGFHSIESNTGVIDFFLLYAKSISSITLPQALIDKIPASTPASDYYLPLLHSSANFSVSDLSISNIEFGLSDTIHGDLISDDFDTFRKITSVILAQSGDNGPNLLNFNSVVFEDFQHDNINMKGNVSQHCRFVAMLSPIEILGESRMMKVASSPSSSVVVMRSFHANNIHLESVTSKYSSVLEGIQFFRGSVLRYNTIEFSDITYSEISVSSVATVDDMNFGTSIFRAIGLQTGNFIGGDTTTTSPSSSSSSSFIVKDISMTNINQLSGNEVLLRGLDILPGVTPENFHQVLISNIFIQRASSIECMSSLWVAAVNIRSGFSSAIPIVQPPPSTTLASPFDLPVPTSPSSSSSPSPILAQPSTFSIHNILVTDIELADDKFAFKLTLSYVSAVNLMSHLATFENIYFSEIHTKNIVMNIFVFLVNPSDIDTGGRYSHLPHISSLQLQNTTTNEVTNVLKATSSLRIQNVSADSVTLTSTHQLNYLTHFKIHTVSIGINIVDVPVFIIHGISTTNAKIIMKYPIEDRPSFGTSIGGIYIYGSVISSSSKSSSSSSAVFNISSILLRHISTNLPVNRKEPAISKIVDSEIFGFKSSNNISGFDQMNINNNGESSFYSLSAEIYSAASTSNETDAAITDVAASNRIYGFWFAKNPLLSSSVSVRTEKLNISQITFNNDGAITLNTSIELPSQSSTSEFNFVPVFFEVPLVETKTIEITKMKLKPDQLNLFSALDKKNVSSTSTALTTPRRTLDLVFVHFNSIHSFNLLRSLTVSEMEMDLTSIYFASANDDDDLIKTASLFKIDEMLSSSSNNNNNNIEHGNRSIVIKNITFIAKDKNDVIANSDQQYHQFHCEKQKCFFADLVEYLMSLTTTTSSLSSTDVDDVPTSWYFANNEIGSHGNYSMIRVDHDHQNASSSLPPTTIAQTEAETNFVTLENNVFDISYPRSDSSYPTSSFVGSSSSNSNHSSLTSSIPLSNTIWIIKCNTWLRNYERNFIKELEGVHRVNSALVECDRPPTPSESYSVSQDLTNYTKSSSLSADTASSSLEPTKSHDSTRDTLSQTLSHATPSLSISIALPKKKEVTKLIASSQTMAEVASIAQLSAAGAVSGALRSKAVLGALGRFTTGQCGIESIAEEIEETPEIAMSPLMLYFAPSATNDEDSGIDPKTYSYLLKDPKTNKTTREVFGTPPLNRNGGYLTGMVVGNVIFVFAFGLVWWMIFEAGKYYIRVQEENQTKLKRKRDKIFGREEEKKEKNKKKPSAEGAKTVVAGDRDSEAPLWERFVDSKAGFAMFFTAILLLPGSLTAAAGLLLLDQIPIHWKIICALLAFGVLCILGFIVSGIYLLVLRKPKIEKYVLINFDDSDDDDDKKPGNIMDLRRNKTNNSTEEDDLDALLGSPPPQVPQTTSSSNEEELNNKTTAASTMKRNVIIDKENDDDEISIPDHIEPYQKPKFSKPRRLFEYFVGSQGEWVPEKLGTVLTEIDYSLLDIERGYEYVYENNNSNHHHRHHHHHHSKNKKPVSKHKILVDNCGRKCVPDEHRKKVYHPVVSRRDHALFIAACPLLDSFSITFSNWIFVEVASFIGIALSRIIAVMQNDCKLEIIILSATIGLHCLLALIFRPYVERITQHFAVPAFAIVQLMILIGILEGSFDEEQLSLMAVVLGASQSTIAFLTLIAQILPGVDYLYEKHAYSQYVEKVKREKLLEGGYEDGNGNGKNNNRKKFSTLDNLMMSTNEREELEMNLIAPASPVMSPTKEAEDVNNNNSKRKHRRKRRDNRRKPEVGDQQRMMVINTPVALQEVTEKRPLPGEEAEPEKKPALTATMLSDHLMRMQTMDML